MLRLRFGSKLQQCLIRSAARSDARSRIRPSRLLLCEPFKGSPSPPPGGGRSRPVISRHLPSFTLPIRGLPPPLPLSPFHRDVALRLPAQLHGMLASIALPPYGPPLLSPSPLKGSTICYYSGAGAFYFIFIFILLAFSVLLKSFIYLCVAVRGASRPCAQRHDP